MAVFKAYAKINWILNIVGSKDGFHMLDGVMETVGLYDVISINVRKDNSINTVYKDMEAMDGDLCRKGAAAFFERSGIAGGADIHVEKHIPMGAGLGGGSSDCACVLCYLNEYYGEPLSRTELADTAARLGADVAFFIDGGAQRAKGKGELLSSVEGVQPQKLIIAMPKGERVSTPAAFKLYDSMGEKKAGNVEAMIGALKGGDIREIGRQMHNSLEVPSMVMVPSIRDVKERLLSAGAAAAMMTGSGSAVVGLIGKASIDESRLADMWYCICDTVKKPRERIN